MDSDFLIFFGLPIVLLVLIVILVGSCGIGFKIKQNYLQRQGIEIGYWETMCIDSKVIVNDGSVTVKLEDK